MVRRHIYRPLHTKSNQTKAKPIRWFCNAARCSFPSEFLVVAAKSSNFLLLLFFLPFFVINQIIMRTDNNSYMLILILSSSLSLRRMRSLVVLPDHSFTTRIIISSIYIVKVSAYMICIPFCTVQGADNLIIIFILIYPYNCLRAIVHSELFVVFWARVLCSFFSPNARVVRNFC